MIEAKLNIIDTPEKFKKLKDWFSKFKPEYLILDCETDGLFEKTAKLYGLGLCSSEKNAFYFPWRTPQGLNVWSENEEIEITQFLLQLSRKTKVIGHNIIFDILIIKNNLGIDLTDYIYCDTILLTHTLMEEGPFGLKDICVQELGEWADKAKEKLYENIKANGGKTTKNEMEMFKADSNILGEYCMWDVLLTFLLFKHLSPSLKEQELEKLFYEEEVMPLYKTVTIPMKDNGFPIDIAYYKKLEVEISKEIERLENEILEDVGPHVASFCNELLDNEVPISISGIYPKRLAEALGAPIPLAKKKDKVTGAITYTPTMSKSAILKQKEQTPEFNAFYDWVLGNVKISEVTKKINSTEKILFGEKYIPLEIFQKVQLDTYLERKGGRNVFNLRSNDHLAYLLFTCLGHQAKELTPGGKPKVNDDYFESLRTSEPIITKLIDFKKLNKLLSTYVDGILSRQYEGKIYTSMLQFGTTSGRYSSRDPNLQNLPRIKDDIDISPLVLKYTNSIRKGLISGIGCKIIDSDYQSLEPRCFSSVTEDPGLLEIWHKGLDLYSTLAISIFGLKGVSADPKSTNYLKHKMPEMRIKAKVIALAIPYGSEESRVKELLDCSYAEARSTINKYLEAYPGLKKYMFNCNLTAKNKGYIINAFGRVRHLEECRSIYTLYGDKILDYKWAKNQGEELLQLRRKYKNMLNNSKNFPIQSLAACIINRSMISLSREFKKRSMKAYIALMIHDQVVCIAPNEEAEEVKQLMQHYMENTVKLNIPLVAEPTIAENLAESH